MDRTMFQSSRKFTLTSPSSVDSRTLVGDLHVARQRACFQNETRNKQPDDPVNKTKSKRVTLPNFRMKDTKTPSLHPLARIMHLFGS
mmetsp:Transcript_4539/g.9075  ORF Transcript_4539/g.9075 Transcript_4539/m.9075 type:complete len:87 (+) Transcript_4539:304-564(+)